MCKCTPNVKTPFCGKPGCEWQNQAVVNLNMPRAAEERERRRLKINGVGRDTKFDKSLLIYLSRPASDDEMRRVHDVLKGHFA